MKLALLISGGGTTAVEIINACKHGGVLHGLIEPALVIASKPDIKGIERVKATGMISEASLAVLDPQILGDQFGSEILGHCSAHNVELIGQYGWMPLTPKAVIRHYQDRIINQHPAPVHPGHPDFGGLYMHGQRAHCARLLFVRMTNRNFWTEATAQQVHEEWDRGELFHTERVEILRDDEVGDLQKRTLPAEYRVQIETLRRFGTGTISTYRRAEPLVLPHEIMFLEMAKRLARMLYPKKP